MTDAKREWTILAKDPHDSGDQLRWIRGDTYLPLTENLPVVPAADLLAAQAELAEAKRDRDKEAATVDYLHKCVEAEAEMSSERADRIDELKWSVQALRAERDEALFLLRECVETLEAFGDKALGASGRPLARQAKELVARHAGRGEK